MGKTEATRVKSSAAIQKRFLSAEEINAIYGVPVKTLANWRVTGRGPAYKKFGVAVRYDIRVFEAFLDELPTGGAGIASSSLRSA